MKQSRLIRIALLALALTIAALLPLVSSAQTAFAADCADGEVTSKAYTNDKGFVIEGGECIPGDRIPGTVEYAYAYQALCQPNIPDDCAPHVCFEAEAPARLFAVIMTTLATGESQYMGAGCYSTKNDPPKITPGDVLAKLKTRDIPKATITVQPPGGRTLVNFKTIVSSNAAPYEENVPIFGQNVHLWIRPIAWTWDFGDGSDPLVREDGGVAWATGVTMSQITEDTYTFHEYTAATEFDIGLTVTWTADYQVGSDPPRAVPGTVDITSPTVGIEALEARPELVDDPLS